VVVRLVAAVLAVVGLTAWASRSHPAPPSTETVAFVVALRTFESQSAALADQAVAQSSSAPVRAAASVLATHANSSAARVWALLDQWHVPGLQRLPQASVGSVVAATPTARLRHACGIVAADELGRLAVMSGAAFDQSFVRDWIDHAQSALVALQRAPSLAVARDADRLLHQDISTLAAAT
jgi:predicted outer membrane protein